MSTSNGSTSIPLRVGGVPEHFNLPWHLAMEANAFTNHGVGIDYNDVPEGTGAMMRALSDQALDIAIVLAEGGVCSLLKGNRGRIVKTYVESPLIWGIHVSAESSIDEITEIKNKRYAISRYGSGSHLMAIVDASERDWPTQGMKFEKIDNLEGARKALAEKEADIFFWERFTTAPYVQSGEFRRVGERRTLWPAFVICVHDDVLATRPKDVKTVLEIINQTCAQLMANENACELISQRYDLRLNDVNEWYSQTKWSTDFVQPTEALENIKEYLVKLSIVTPDQAKSKKLWYEFEME